MLLFATVAPEILHFVWFLLPLLQGRGQRVVCFYARALVERFAALICPLPSVLRPQEQFLLPLAGGAERGGGVLLEIGTQRTRALSSAELQSNKSSLRINEITFRSNDHHLLILLDLFPLLCLFAAAAAATEDARRQRRRLRLSVAAAEGGGGVLLGACQLTWLTLAANFK